MAHDHGKGEGARGVCAPSKAFALMVVANNKQMQ